MEYATANRIVCVLVFASALMLMTLGIGTVSALPWQNVTVDAAGAVGGGSSLALDTAGYPHIAFYNETNGDLKYAWGDDAGWHTETVDSALVTAWSGSPSLVLDSAGNPHVPYYDATNKNLKYAWKDDAGWHTETVDPASGDKSSRFASLALDGAGNPRICYLSTEYVSGWWDEYLIYAWHDGSSWHIENTMHCSYFTWPILALDSAGNPHIGVPARHGGGDTAGLAYLWKDGSVWKMEYIASGGMEGYASPSLALDSAGTPHVSYPYGSAVVYAWRTASGWQSETVVEGGADSPSLVLDAVGNPLISYIDVENTDLVYAWRDGAGWHTETVDPSGGESTSMALDSAGNPGISYLDAATHALKYASASLMPTTPRVIAIQGAAGLPTDTNNDGKYDDVNGNGRADFADVVLYFNQMTWIADHEPVGLFDYNGNGRIDFADVVWLFNNL